jgi:hypothetical protein
MNYDQKTKDKFWRRVRIGNTAECWLWLGATFPTGGYGSFWIDPRCRRAHRIAFELTFGNIPEGKMVLHKCDNPPCCNPMHLMLGDNESNMRDRDIKGRTLNGERINTCKLKSSESALRNVLIFTALPLWLFYWLTDHEEVCYRLAWLGWIVIFLFVLFGCEPATPKRNAGCSHVDKPTGSVWDGGPRKMYLRDEPTCLWAEGSEGK